MWPSVFSDQWVLETVTQDIKFHTVPIFGLLEGHISQGTVTSGSPLTSLGPVERVPSQYQEKGLYFKYYFIPEKKRGWHPILDL